MIFYTLLIIYSILIISYMYCKKKADREKAERNLQESYENLKDAWHKFTGLF